MAIKKLVTKGDAAEKKFRTLPEVDKTLDKVDQTLDELDQLTRSFQSQFARSETALKAGNIEQAAPFVYEVNLGEDPPPRRKKIDVKTDKFDKVVIPKPELLRKNFDVVTQLHDQVETLKTIYNSVSTNLSGVKGSVDTLKRIKAMLSSANSKVDKALKFLQTVGERYAPAPFRKLVDTSINLIEEGLDFKGYQNFLYATETVHKELQFTHYVVLNGLLDNDGGQYPVFYVVFTCLLKPEGKQVVPEYYVTVMHEFAAPGQFGLGKAITTPKEAQNAIYTLFHLENVANTLGTVPHGLDPERLTKDKFSIARAIKTIEVTHNSILFVLLKDTPKKAIPEIGGKLYHELTAKLNRRSVKFKAKVTKTEAGYPAIEFQVRTLAQDNQVSVNDLDYLQTVLKVDDAKMRQIVKIING